MAESGVAPMGVIRKEKMIGLLRRPTLERTGTQLLQEHVQELSGLHERKPDPERKKSGVTEDGESSGAEYDTDLEEEAREETPEDRWGQATYARTCRRLGRHAIGAVRRGLRGSAIEVRGRGLDECDSLAIATGLLTNSVVTSLVLDDNRLGAKGTEYLAYMLQENVFIMSLSLASNHIGGHGTRCILETLLQNTTLTHLTLSGNELTDAEAFLVADLLYENNTLTYLDLSYNNFGDDAGLALGPVLGANESLRVLDLSWNKIRAKGGVSLCRGLQANVVLRRLNLAYNGLSLPGAVAMAEALQVNETLTDLDLTCNRIFDHGIKDIGKALTLNETLKYLRISNNPLTTASAMALLVVLQKNPYSALEVLDMSSVHIYRQSLTVLDHIRHIRPVFKFLYGGIVNSDDSFGQEEDAFSHKNPLMILKEYIASKNLRLVDLFKQFDKDGSGSVSRDEFIDGLKSIDVPLTVSQLDRLITMLDKDGDGEVDYGELVSGDREYRRQRMRIKQDALMKMQAGRKRKKKVLEQT